MTDSTHVRRAREEDGDRLREIDLETWSSSVSPAPPPEEGQPFFSERHPAGDALVCELEDRVVGYVLVQRGFRIPSHAHVLEVGGLAVDPSVQGHGVGQALVEAAIQEARERGAAKLSLRVLGPNVGARRLYERCGFRVEGVLAGEFLLDGAEVDDVLMARPIG